MNEFTISSAKLILFCDICKFFKKKVKIFMKKGIFCNELVEIIIINRWLHLEFKIYSLFLFRGLIAKRQSWQGHLA